MNHNDAPRSLKRRKRLGGLITPLAIALTAAFAISAAAWSTAILEQRQYESRIRADVVSEAGLVRAALEQELNARLALVDGLRAFAEADPGFTIEEFTEYAKALERSRFSGDGVADPAVRSLQLAPDAVVTYVHPLEGNEAAIGHDLRGDPDRRDAVQAAIDGRIFVLAGPFELLQGGLGLVGRKPIYLPDGSGSEVFWGFATIVINFDELLEDAAVTVHSEHVAYALRGKDGLGADGEVFFGATELFDSEPISLSVTLPNGTWQLAAAPANGWPSGLRAVGWLIGLAGMLVAAALAWSFWRWVRAEAAASQAAEDLARLVTTANAPIMGIGLDGRVEEWNDEAARITGIARDDIVGIHLASSPLADLNTPEDRQRTTNVLARVFAGEDQRAFDVRWHVEGSRPVVLSFNVSPRRDEAGNVIGAIAVGQDISARLEAEAIRTQNLAMERSAEMRDQFLASMSHELRTPLNAVIGFSTVLKGKAFGPLNDKQTEYVSQIEQSGRHLLGLINDVLDLAKIEAEQEILDLVEVDVAALVTEALGMVEQMTLDAGLQLERNIVECPRIVADTRRLRQVVLNLLSNAVKFTHPGGRVGVDVGCEAEHVTISVWDTGIGIAPENLDVLFQPFHQIDSGLDRSYEGSGLGLALSKSLVDLHGGEITLTSTPGEGSRFTVRFPVAGPGQTGAETEENLATALNAGEERQRGL